MGQCYAKVQKTKRIYDVVDDVANIDEPAALNEIIEKRTINMELLRKHVTNEVQFHFIQPDFITTGMDADIQNVLNSLLQVFGVDRINIVTH